MTAKKPLEPNDFPTQAKDKKIVKNDGEPIAEAKTEKIAEDISERLNADDFRREEDRWA